MQRATRRGTVRQLPTTEEMPALQKTTQHRKRWLPRATTTGANKIHNGEKELHVRRGTRDGIVHLEQHL